MQKFLRTVLLMACLIVPWVTSAQVTVTIGEGTTTNSYLPAYTLYNNTLSEQIYTADEIEMGGTITSIAFFNGGTEKTPNIKIYLINTDQEEFSSTTNWLTVSADDLVYEGDVTFVVGEWTTIQLETPFEYDGVSNLGVIVDENMTWSSGLACRVFGSTDNCAMYVYSDGTDYNAVGATYTANSRLSVKNQLQLTIIPGSSGPMCYKVKDLAIDESSTTSSSLTITWTDDRNDASATYTIYNGDVVVASGVTGTSYTVQGLNPNTVYALSVATDCGAGNVSNRTAPVSGRTDCAATTPIPFADDFSGYGTLPSYPYSGPSVLPSCWAYFSNGTNTARTEGSSYFGGIGKYTSTSSYGTPYANDPFLCMPIYLVGSAVTSSTYIGYGAARGNTKYAILPNFEEALNTLQISFDYRMSTAYNATAAATTLELGYVIGEDTSTFVSMKSYQASTALNKVLEQNLSLLAANAPAGARLAFKFSGVHNGTTTSSYGQYYAGIDNLVVEPIPSCIRVSGLTVQAVTSSSVTLKWNDEYNSGASYSVYAVTPTETTLVGIANAGDTTITVVDLTPNTQYVLGVEANCSETDASAMTTVSVHTNCGAEPIPFAEYFDASLSSNQCWRGASGMSADSVFNGGVLNLGTNSNWTYASGEHDGHPAGSYYKNVYGTNQYMWMITPEIDLTTAEMPQMSFDISLTDYAAAALPEENGDTNTSQAFMVIISTDGGATWPEENATIWQHGQEQTYASLASLEYVNKVISLEQYVGQTIRIAFYTQSVWSGGDNDLSIDNLLVGEVPTCDALSGLTVGDVFGRTAELSWEGEADSYKVEYRKSNESEWTSIMTEENPYTLTDLDPVTAYTARVSAMCDNVSSYPTAVVNFTTKAACQVPTNLNVDPLAYSAIVTWHDTIATAWEVAYVDYANAPTDTITVTVEGETTYTIEELNPETQYKLHVRALCGDEDGVSNWTATKTFTTTPACAAPTNIRYINTPGDGTVATIAWHDIQASQWEIVLMNVTDTLDTEGDTTFFFEDLTAEQAYTVKVRAVCGENVSAWASFTFTPSGKTTIGTNQTTNSYIPTYTLYNNSFNQQIYTVAELGEAGVISSIEFYCTSAPSTSTRAIDIYMVLTDKSSFTGATDWVTVSASDKVYTGTKLFTQGWNTFEFNTPFYYDGTMNVVLVIDDNTGSYNGTNNFGVFNATAQTLRIYSDPTNYDPTSPSGYSGTIMDVKNYIRIMKSEPPACAPVTGLTATEVHAFEATVSWNETEADVYMLQYKVATENDWEEIETAETTYTLALEENTTYNVRVKGICGDDESDYSSVVTLTTPPACVTPTNLRVVLDEQDFSVATVKWTDSVGSLWEIRYANASDTSVNGSIFEEVADTIFSEFEEPLEPDTWYYVKVRTLCGDEGESDWSEWVAFQTNIACEEPTNVRFIGTMGDATVATIEWDDENAEAWEIRLIHYGENGVNDTSETYSVDEGEPTFFFEDLVAETEYRAEVRANCGDYLSRWAGKDFTPSLKTIIGTAQTTNSYLPTYGFYNYTLSQQIYTAEELGLAGMISSIDLLPNGSQSRTLDVYMVSTTKSSFASGTDWITVTAADKVFSGSVNFTSGEWTTITFDVPFMYNGQSNVALIVDDNTGSYVSGLSFYVFDAQSQAIRVYSDGTNYDPYSPSSYSGTVMNLKNHIRIMKSEPPACEIPGNLTASDITGHEATLEWEGGDDAEEVYIQYKKATSTTWTDVLAEENPFTLTDLDQNTAYNARVMIICEGDSLTSPAVNFNTLITCEDPTGTITAVPTPGNGTVMGVAWHITNAEEAMPIQLVISLDDEIIESIEVADSGSYTFENLTPEQIYTIGVRFVCDAENNDYSGYLSTTCNPSNKIIVGDAETTNSYLPTYSFYNYTVSEQIYTATELGSTAGAIMSIDFMNGGTEKTRDIDVYLVSTTKTEFTSNTDWIHPTAGDLVFSGEVTFTPNEWVTLEFENPFTFDGTSNVALIVDDNTGSYSSGLTCYVFAAGDNTAIYKYNDPTNYNPATIAETGTRLSVKNHVRFLIGEPPTCPKPRDLAVGTIGKHTAELSWTEKGEAEMWQIRVNGDDEWIVDAPENPFTLEGLEIETEYTVEVRAYCDEEDQSEWSNAISFTTDIACPAVTNVEVIPGPTVAIFNWSDASSEEGTLYNIYMMEDGLPTIAAEGLTLASLPYTVEGLDPETPYVFGVQAVCTEGNADTIFVEFTTDVNCPTPYDLTVDEESITANEATVEWIGFSEGYNVRYRPAAPSGEGLEESFENGMGDWTTIDADNDGYTWVLGSACGGIYLVDGGSLTDGHTGSDMIVSGSYSNATNVALTPDNYLVSPMVNLGGSISFWAQAQDATYAEEHLGVAVSTTSNTDATAFTTIQEWTMSAEGADPGAKDPGVWVELTVDLSNYAGQTGYVAIRHFNCTDMFILNIDDITIVEPDTEAPEEPWVTITTENTNVTLSGLNSATTYEFQVQATCDEESWSEVAHFTTIPSCLALTDLEVVDSLTTNSSVTLSWVNPNEGEGTIVVTDGEGNVLTITETETGCTVTGLEANTSYTFYVRLYCSDVDSSAAVSVRTRTKCAPISELPYVEDFEGIGIYCWTSVNFNSISGYGIDGSACIFANPGDSNYAILPVMEANISDLALSFFTANYNSNSTEGVLYIGYVNANGDTASFVSIDTVIMADYDVEFLETPTFIFDGAPAGSRMAIKSVTNRALFIDNVTVMEKPTCFRPTALTYDNVQNHSVELSWTEMGEATAWQIMLNGDEETITPATENPFVLTGLAADTTYTVQVRANCGDEDGVSEWSSAISFTTLIACPAPTGVTVTSGPYSAIVNWTPSIYEGVTYNIYSYNEDGEINEEPVATGITELPYTITGLEPQTSYHFAVAVDCSGNNDGESELTDFTVNTTVACPAPTLFVTTATATTISVSWTDANSDLATYNLYRFIAAGDTATVATGITYSQLPYTIEGLTPNTSYTFIVQSICPEDLSSNKVQFSAYTNEECPENMICIGAGNGTNTYLPTYCYYNYSLTEQIYTAEELGDATTITSVDIKNTGSAITRNVDVYLANTNKSAFANSTDWVAVTEGEKVFSGEVTFASGEWTTINFNTPFEYDGVSNIVLAFDDNTGSYVSSVPFAVFNATNQAIRVYNDYTDYDPVAPSSYSGTVLSVKNRVRFGTGEAPVVHTVTVTAMPADGGAVYGIDGEPVVSPMTIADGEPLTLSATAAEGYEFFEWQIGDGIYTENPLNIEAVTADMDIVAVFNQAPVVNYYTVTVSYDAVMGTIIGIPDEAVEEGTSVTLMASPATCYNFVDWKVNGQTVSEEANYTFTVNEDVNLEATFVAVENYAEPIDITACDSYEWNGEIYTTSDTYTAETVDVEGCVLIETLNLTINYSNTGIDEQTACDEFEWIDGNVYTESNNEATFTLEGGNIYGCDSVVTLNLTVNYSNSENVVETINENDLPYTFMNNEYEAPVVREAIEAGLNVDGCDSTVYLTLIVNMNGQTNDFRTICDNELPYTWNDVEFTEAGMQSVTLEDIYGADSVVNMYLTVNFGTHTTQTVVACNEYIWRGETYTESATYVYDYTNVDGCASDSTLNLTINTPVHVAETVEECESYTWNGTEYTVSGDYTFAHEDVNGCNQVDTLHLTIKNSTIGVDVQTACDTYTWIDGIEYTASNNEATFTMENAAGCDSVITLNLTINNSNTGVDVQTACDSYTWINGETYTASNNEATFTLTNAAGCDSVVTLNLTVNYSNTGIDEHTACDTYTWIDGIEYTASNNEATFTLENANAAGCDSVVTLNLTINNSNTGVDVQTACDSYTWIDGIEYTASNNEATFTLTNAAGCDSVVTLNLTINNSVNETLDITAMDSYTFNGIVFTEDTTYVYTGTTVNGCDSIVTLHLTITHNTDIVVILTVNDATMGTTNPVAGTYVFSAGDVVTATATANEGYEFVGWVASMGSYSDTVSREATVTYELLPMMQGMTINVEAVFQAAQVPPTTYTVTVNYDATMGTVTSVPETLTGLAAGTEVTLTATALEGYEFTNWTDTTGTALNATNPYTFTVTENVTINANFQAVVVPPTYYTVNISVNPAEAGIVNGMPDTNAVVAGTELHLTAVPANNGYVFVNWTVNDTTVEGATLDTVVNADMTIVANFEATVPQTYYTVNISVNPAEAGIVNGVPSSSSVVAGTELHLTAIPANNGYVFVNWTVNDTTVEGATLDTVVNADMTIVANFENSIVPPTYYTVTVNYDATMGTVEGIPTTQTVAEGTQLTLTATALEGYEFVNWTVNGQTVEGATYTTTVNADLTIIANFQAVVVPPTYYTVTVNYDETMGTVEGIPTEAVEAGSNVTLTATAKTNYRFVGWLIGEDTVSHEATYTIEDIQSDVTISAVFVSTIGINDVDMSNVSIYSANSTIYVKGAEGQTIHIYDLNGRTVVTKTNAAETMAIPMDETGVYLVRVGNAAAKRVMLMR